jgi:hypothetical protein
LNREIGSRIRDYIAKDRGEFLKKVLEKHKRKFEDDLTRELNFKRDPLARLEEDHALDISSEDHQQNEREVPMQLVLTKNEETENQIKKDVALKKKTTGASEYVSQRRSTRASFQPTYPQNPVQVVTIQVALSDQPPATRNLSGVMTILVGFILGILVFIVLYLISS